jgi:hypothetical protein
MRFGQVAQASRAVKKYPAHFVIPSEARNDKIGYAGECLRIKCKLREKPTG